MRSQHEAEEIRRHFVMLGIRFCVLIAIGRAAIPRANTSSASASERDSERAVRPHRKSMPARVMGSGTGTRSTILDAAAINPMALSRYDLGGARKNRLVRRW